MAYGKLIYPPSCEILQKSPELFGPTATQVYGGVVREYTNYKNGYGSGYGYYYSPDDHEKALKKDVENAVEETRQNKLKAMREVGDFVADLTTATLRRPRMGLFEGDDLAEGYRAFTDRRCFSEEIIRESSGKMQVTLSLDMSGSMFSSGIIVQAGQVYQQMHEMLRMAQREMPEGVLLYQPFIYHSCTFAIPDAFVPRLALGNKGWGRHNFSQYDGPGIPTPEEFAAAVRAGQISKNANPNEYVLGGGGTYIGDLFEKIQAWEQGQDIDDKTVRIDIIITDGALDEGGSHQLTRATQIQMERGGRLVTRLLNFLPPKQWMNREIPEGMVQYGVNLNNLRSRIRMIMEEGMEEVAL